ncbi:MAG: retroviral-like aspartic protease family protein [Defluviitaleaceae bacterium]|nr:retroviral-like aspartic protease family protein [Defluviitaleaceae bacterium]
MSKFTIGLNSKKPYRYTFDATLWESKRNRFSRPVKILLDTGAFNTAIHDKLVEKFGTMLEATMKISIGGFAGEVNLCVLNKIKMGDFVIEKVIALAVPFEGELRDHILLGANVTNNWKFTISRLENTLDVVEQFSGQSLTLKHPYRYCYSNKGQVIAFQECSDG